MKLRLPQVSEIKGKRVLVRVDYNVPLKKVDGDQTVADGRRLQASLDTIHFLLKHQAKVVLISHLGRPQSPNDKKYSLEPIAEYLKAQWDLPITFIKQTVGPEVQHAVNQLQPGSILLLENLRFHPEEKKNDASFAKALAQLGDVYINEAFSTAHRAHASTVGVTKYLPSFAGFALAQEVTALSHVLLNPKRPLVVVAGGAKIADKVDALTHLAAIADTILVGGGIANIFLKADGLEIHKSYMQDAPVDLKQQGIDYLHVAHDLMEETKTEKTVVDGVWPLPKILYPLDVVAARSLESERTEIIDLTHNMKDTEHDKSLMYLDIGPKTIKLYQEILKKAGTIFWNGPLGVFEKPLFAKGTREVARTSAESQAYSVIGGGDTIAAMDHFDLTKEFSYVSTAGGAALEFLAGKKLPGLEPLLV